MIVMLILAKAQINNVNLMREKLPGSKLLCNYSAMLLYISVITITYNDTTKTFFYQIPRNKIVVAIQVQKSKPIFKRVLEHSSNKINS